MRRKTLIVLISASICLATEAVVFLLSPEAARHAAAESGGNSPQSAKDTNTANAGGGSGVAADPAASAANVPGMEKAAENQTLVLFVNKKTAETAVYDKRTGKVWYSNPQDRDSDAKASPFEKEGLASQFSLTFSDNVGNSKTFLSFNDSVKNKQFDIQTVPSGIRIVYTLGDTSKGINVLPKWISKKRLDQFLTKIDKDSASYVLRRYELREDKGLYERFDESISSDVILKRMTDAFQAAGYNPDDLAQDNAESHVADDTTNAKPVFTVPLEFKLDADNLIVSIATDQLKEPPNNVITEIQLFKYFAAAGLKDQGYMLVPDGSGSLIYLNNGKFKDDIYSQPVYGSDEAIRRRQKEQNSEVARLPVFGMKSGDSAMYGIIEKGAAVASVNAEVSGRTNSYNYAYGSFSIRNKDELPLGNGQSFNYVTVLQSRKVQGELSVRFGFLYGKDAGYEGMAKAYQDYLVRNFNLKRTESGKDLPFFMDLVGSIPKRKSFLGVPYEAMEPLTSFSQAQTIIGELKKSSISNIKLRYLGWFNGGVNHKLPTHISVDGKLGGRAGLHTLETYLKANGIDFYPDVSFTRVFHNTWSFSPSRDASRFIIRSVVEKYPYDPAFLRLNPDLGDYYLTSPHKLPSYVDDYLKSFQPLEIGGLSLRYMGAELNPDYKVGRVYDRQQAADIVTEQLKKISVQVPDLLVSGGNAYALPYAKNLIDVPQSDTHFNVADETVPFYQMVVHGFIPYAGKPINLAADQDITFNLLKALEYGANIRFQWIYNDASSVKDTEFNSLYSGQYQEWLQDAKSMYEQANKALKDVQNLRITQHRKVQEGVYATTYENGKTIIVNYTGSPVNVNGLMVEAKNYAIGGKLP